MKRALRIAAALMVLCASTASARWLVVDNGIEWNTRVKGSAGSGGLSTPELRLQVYRNERMNLDILDRLGADYVLVPASACKTVFCWSGDYVWNYGTSAAYVEHMDGVIHLEWNGLKPVGATNDSSQYTRITTGYNPDSLTLLAYYAARGGGCKVPQVFIFGGAMGSGFSGTGAYCDRATCAGLSCSPDTIGIKPTADNSGAYPTVVVDRNTGLRWFGPGHHGGKLILNPTVPAGGIRPLLSYNAPAARLYQWTGVDTNAPDSLLGAAASDSVIVWERRMLFDPSFTNYYGAKPLVFANTMGGAPCFDSLMVTNGDGYLLPCEGSQDVALYVYQHADSLSGGKLFPASTFRGPQNVAITIDGVCATGRRTFLNSASGSGDVSGGECVDDSTTAKDTRDSLATLRDNNGRQIPFTVGVNVDSIATYQSVLNSWVAKVPSAHFTAQSWMGLRDTISIVYKNSWNTYHGTKPWDTFGRYHNRVVKGDGTVRDSSIYRQVLVSDSILAANVPADRISQSVMAPLDDWTPANVAWNSSTANATTADSVLWLLASMGKKAVRIDNQRPATKLDRYRGWFYGPGIYREPIGGRDIKLVGHSGYHIAGSYRGWDTRNDSTVAAMTSFTHYASWGGNGPNQNYFPLLQAARFWSGIWHERWRDQDDFPRDGNGYEVSFIADTSSMLARTWFGITTPMEDMLYGLRRASVVKMHAVDFGGVVGGPPSRPGWWALKSMVNSVNAINAAGLRRVVQFVYLEDATP